MIPAQMLPMMPPIVETNDFIAEQEGIENRNETLMGDTKDNAGDIITKLDENVATVDDDQDGIDDIDNVINNNMNDIVAVFDNNTPRYEYTDDNFVSARLDDAYSENKDGQILASLNRTEFDNGESHNIVDNASKNSVECQDEYHVNV